MTTQTLHAVEEQSQPQPAAQTVTHPKQHLQPQRWCSQQQDPALLYRKAMYGLPAHVTAEETATIEALLSFTGRPIFMGPSNPMNSVVAQQETSGAPMQMMMPPVNTAQAPAMPASSSHPMLPVVTVRSATPLQITEESMSSAPSSQVGSQKTSPISIMVPSLSAEAKHRPQQAPQNDGHPSAASLSLSSLITEEDEGTGANGEGDGDRKPPISYASLITQAILSAPTKRMTLANIYNFISSKYRYYRQNGNGWQNSVRHNLSLNKAFIKVPREPHESGKGMYWTVDPRFAEELIHRPSSRRTNGSSSSRSSTRTATPVPEIAAVVPPVAVRPGGSDSPTCQLIRPEILCPTYDLKFVQHYVPPTVVPPVHPGARRVTAIRPKPTPQSTMQPTPQPMMHFSGLGKPTGYGTLGGY